MAPSCFAVKRKKREQNSAFSPGEAQEVCVGQPPDIGVRLMVYVDFTSQK